MVEDFGTRTLCPKDFLWFLKYEFKNRSTNHIEECCNVFFRFAFLNLVKDFIKMLHVFKISPYFSVYQETWILIFN